MIAAEVLAVLGYLREDFRTVVSAILSIIAGTYAHVMIHHALGVNIGDKYERRLRSTTRG